MSKRIAAAALQYSKRLSRLVSWFWVIHHVLTLIAAVIAPEAAQSIMQVNYMIDIIMMVNLATYMCNSLGEKILYAQDTVHSFFKKDGRKDENNEEGEENG